MFPGRNIHFLLQCHSLSLFLDTVVFVSNLTTLTTTETSTSLSGDTCICVYTISKIYIVYISKLTFCSNWSCKHRITLCKVKDLVNKYILQSKRLFLSRCVKGLDSHTHGQTHIPPPPPTVDWVSRNWVPLIHPQGDRPNTRRFCLQRGCSILFRKRRNPSWKSTRGDETPGVLGPKSLKGLIGSLGDSSSPVSRLQSTTAGVPSRGFETWRETTDQRKTRTERERLTFR